MTLVRLKPNNTTDFFRENVVSSNIMSLIDSVFNDSVTPFERNVFFSPRVDVLEKTNQFEIHMALPGLTKDEISIEIEKDTLKVSGEKKSKVTNEGEKYHKVENFYGKFSRTFNLPEHSNKESIEAEFENGMLNVVIPKSEIKETRNTIKIK